MGEFAGKKLKWGILGTGWISEQFTKDLLYVTNGEGFAVASRTQENADAFAKRHGLPRAYGSYEQLLKDPEIDVVYIATPHPQHHDNVMAALQAGKAVLCEKPFTVNSSELEEMIKLAGKKGLFLMEAMWTRFLPAIVKTREWIKEGRIGEIKLVKAEFGFRTEWNPEGRLLNPQLGGGTLLDVGIYPISFASMIFGTHPVRIHSAVQIGKTGVDEQFSVLLDYGVGRSASLHGAIRLNMTNEAYIYGTEGMIHVPSFFNARTASLQVEGAEEEVFTDDRTSVGYAFEAQEVGECLLRGDKESSQISLEESLSIMGLLDQIRDQWKLKYPFE
ncbi:MAG TPA: Gfo/Idh/MocA family oxidoreductase [Paenibacillus sp.]|jgi:predicted dehydrogenase